MGPVGQECCAHGTWRLLPEDVSTMPDSHDKNQELPLVDFVDNPVCPNPDSPRRTPGQLLAACGPWVIAERTNCLDDPVSVLPVDFSELLLGRAKDVDRIGHAP